MWRDVVIHACPNVLTFGCESYVYHPLLVLILHQSTGVHSHGPLPLSHTNLRVSDSFSCQPPAPSFWVGQLTMNTPPHLTSDTSRHYWNLEVGPDQK